MIPSDRLLSKVLVVDDDDFNIKLLTQILNAHGLEHVRGIRDPREALSAIQAERPDLLLLDLNMPHMDGFEVLRRVREWLPEGDDLPIIMITSEDDKSTRRRALAEGASSFLPKPIQQAELIECIKGLLLKDAGDKTVNSPTLPATSGTTRPDGSIPIDETNPPPVDMEMLEGLSAAMGPESIVELIELFQAQVPQYEADLPRLVQDEDYTSLSRQVHTLKGMSRQMAVTALAAACAAFEQSIATRDACAIQSQLEAVLTKMQDAGLALDEAARLFRKRMG